MNATGVEQLAPLSDLFASALRLAKPASVAILGIAGGNGLPAIDSVLTRRIVGIDVNQEYLDSVAIRYSNLPGLELHRLDLSSERIECRPVNLVHAALVLEHAGTDLCLENAIALVVPGGWLSVVIQLPSESEEGVSPTGFASLQTLKAAFQLIEPEWIVLTLTTRGFELRTEKRHPLPAGKGLWHGMFQSLEAR